MRRRGTDLLIATGIWLFVAFLSGAQAWVAMDTPDSEFHASMAIFTHEVTDRVATPVYYWTRLGYIAPAHLLTQVFGAIPGLEAYRLLMLAVIVAASYATYRRFATRLVAATLATFTVTSTVVIGYLGNPYPTSSVMAGMFTLVYLGLVRRPWLAPALAGLVVGWLVMTSPYGAMLAVTMYLVTFALRDPRLPSWKSIAGLVICAPAGAIVSFSAIWLVGQRLFPGFDWLGTYRFWNSVLNQADYISDRWRWMHDPSLLVPGLAAGIGLGVWIRYRPRESARLSAGLALSVIAFSLAYWYFLPNNYLEIPHYQAMLWPATLTTLSLASMTRLPAPRVSWGPLVMSALGVAAVIWSGHSTLEMSLWTSRLLAIGALLAFVIVGRRWGTIFVVIVVTFVSAQLLQNARDAFGVSSPRLYANAYAANDTAMRLAAASEAERWLIAHTAPGERVLSWVDAQWPPGEQDLLPLAAFHLWGANEAEHGNRVTADTIDRWSASKPTSVVMYGKSTGAVLDFWNGIPKSLRPTPPECLRTMWSKPPIAQICLTHLSW